MVVLGQQGIVWMIFGNKGTDCLFTLHGYYIIISFMNNFQDDQGSWKSKLQLAKQGNSQAIQYIRNYLMPHFDSDHPFATANFTQLIKQSSLRILAKEQSYGLYEMYNKVPIFFVLQGKAAIQCINTEGDSQIICDTQKTGFLELSQTELKIKYGETNITLLTQFQVIAQEKSIIIEFVPKLSIKPLLTSSTNQITARQQAIMKKYMLIALKHITKLTYNKQKPVTNKFYLLQGRACFINNKTKNILCCYEEGFFNPNHLQNSEFSLYIFEGAYIMLLQQEMLKDEVISGIEQKRAEHLQSIQQRYTKMTNQQRVKVQQMLIQKYSLNRQQVNKQILGIQEKQVQKFMKSKNDFRRTSSSMKDKCGIRIRKSKKIN